jgi:hypothetical protein
MKGQTIAERSVSAMLHSCLRLTHVRFAVIGGAEFCRGHRLFPGCGSDDRRHAWIPLTETTVNHAVTHSASALLNANAKARRCEESNLLSSSRISLGFLFSRTGFQVSDEAEMIRAQTLRRREDAFSFYLSVSARVNPLLAVQRRFGCARSGAKRLRAFAFAFEVM